MSTREDLPFRTTLRTLTEEERKRCVEVQREEGEGALPSLDSELAAIQACEKPTAEEWYRWLRDPDERVLSLLFERHGVRAQNFPQVTEWISHRVLQREEEQWHPLLDRAVRFKWLKSEWAQKALNSRLLTLGDWLRGTTGEEGVRELLSFGSLALARLVARSAPQLSDELLREVARIPEATADLASRGDLTPSQRDWLVERALALVVHQNPPASAELAAGGEAGEDVVTRRQRDAGVHVLRALAEQGTHVSLEGHWQLIQALRTRRKVPLAAETLQSLLARPGLREEDFWRMYECLSERLHLLEHLVRHPEAPLPLLVRAAEADQQGQLQNTLAKLPRALGSGEVRRAMLENARTPFVLRSLLQGASREEGGRIFSRLIECSPRSALEILEKREYSSTLQLSPEILAPLLLLPDAQMRLRAMVLVTRPLLGGEEGREVPLGRVLR